MSVPLTGRARKDESHQLLALPSSLGTPVSLDSSAFLVCAGEHQIPTHGRKSLPKLDSRSSLAFACILQTRRVSQVDSNSLSETRFRYYKLMLRSHKVRRRRVMRCATAIMLGSRHAVSCSFWAASCLGQLGAKAPDSLYCSRSWLLRGCLSLVPAGPSRCRRSAC